MTGWNNLLEVRELSLDQPAHQHGVAKLELQLVLCWCEGDLYEIFDIGEKAQQLGVRAGWHDQACLWCRFGEWRTSNSDAVVVGGGERCLLAGELGQHACENRPRLVTGGGEDG